MRKKKHKCMYTLTKWFWQQFIYNNVWVTGNNNFWGHEWDDLSMIVMSDESLANSIKSDQKLVIHGNECIIIFLTRYFTPWTYNSAKTILDRSFPHCRQGWVFFWLSIVTSLQLICCDVTRKRGTGIVTSCSSIVLAHANWRKGELH